MVRIISFCIIILRFLPGVGQDPYQLNMEKELNIMQPSLFFIGSSMIMEYQDKAITITDINHLDKNVINRMDRFVVRFYSKKAATRSDIGMLAPMALGATSLLFYPKRSEESNYFPHLVKLAVLYVESNALNYGGTEFVKHVVKRTRPLAYNNEVELEDKMKKSTRKSFFSGHTSFSATNCFFAAKVFSDYYPESKWKPLVWALALSVPAWTGIERIAAGKHFPTDVIAGYAFGALCGYFVPHMHLKNKKTINGVSLTPIYHPEFTGLSLTCMIQ